MGRISRLVKIVFGTALIGSLSLNYSQKIQEISVPENYNQINDIKKDCIQKQANEEKNKSNYKIKCDREINKNSDIKIKQDSNLGYSKQLFAYDFVEILYESEPSLVTNLGREISREVLKSTISDAIRDFGDYYKKLSKKPYSEFSKEEVSNIF